MSNQIQQLLLFPCGGNTREAIPVIEAINTVEKKWEVIGFIDDNPELHGQEINGYPVIGGKAKLEDYPASLVLAAPGRPENFYRRNLVINSLNLPPERFATLIHPAANLGSGTKIGHNTLIMAGVVTTANIEIGSNCIILPNTVIAHESTIGDYTLIGSNVSLSGSVKIGERCYLGTGAKFIQEITVGDGSLIGLGAIVINSVEPNTVVAGNPAKFLRKVSES